MKNLKVLGLIGLGCGLLLLTGCGGSKHTLKCEKSADQQKVSVELKFNDDETKVEKASIEYTYNGEDYTDDQLKEYKEQMEKECSNSTYDKCEVKLSGKSIILSVSGTADQMGYDDTNSLEDAKKAAEDSGFTCK